MRLVRWPEVFFSRQIRILSFLFRDYYKSLILSNVGKLIEEITSASCHK